MTTELTSLAMPVATLLRRRKETIAVAESSAGGLISAALLAIPGASAYFLGGGIIYTQPARRALLDVDDERVRGIRSSTEDYARVKARAIRELPARERRILYLRFFENRTQSEIAAEIGISQMHVSRILSQTLATLRDAVT